ncbi:MAG TPA: phenylacetate--CoA ligase family protein [Ktedonobacteraceae bacterium]
MSRLETADRSRIEAHQLERLQEGLRRVLPDNRFYRRKLSQENEVISIERLADLARLPFTTKRELVSDQEEHPLFGANLTYPLSEYVRFHQTSGTAGRPLKILDTQESWDWWAECWTSVYRAAGVSRDDVLFLAFGFGPFIGFWSAYEGAKRLGALTVPGGSMDSLQRLRAMQEIGATVLVCTPSYALRLAEVAQEHGIDLRELNVRVTIHAGEPGASIPATRERIEGEFIAEILDPATGQPVQEGQVGELILTNLGRWGCPAIRYRTGDLVRHGGYTCACGRSFLMLPGGVLGRADDMLIVRGVNVYPSALANILHRFPEVREYRVIVTKSGPLDEIALQVECPTALIATIQEEMRLALNLRVPIEPVELGTLPRFELKAKRVVDHRPRM